MGTTNNIKIRFISKDEVQKNSYKMQKGFVCTQSHTNKIKIKTPLFRTGLTVTHDLLPPSLRF